jgi:hypothetical protein
LWAHQPEADMAELVVGTKESIAASGALLQEADRLLAVR